MMWYIIGYYVIGILAVIISAVVHLINAKDKGYDAIEYCTKVSQELEK